MIPVELIPIIAALGLYVLAHANERTGEANYYAYMFGMLVIIALSVMSFTLEIIFSVVIAAHSIMYLKKKKELTGKWIGD